MRVGGSGYILDTLTIGNLTGKVARMSLVTRVIRAGVVTLGVVLLLAACGGGEAIPPTPIGDVTRPELVGLIDWERDPNTIIFRAEIVGGDEDALFRRNEIPPCTIFGDNRVVWLIDSATGGQQAVFEYVSDEAIRLFVEQLVLDYEIYSYGTGEDAADDTDATPVTEVMTLFVNGELHQTDAFSGWDFDYFEEIIDRCGQVGTAPTIFEPQSGYVSAEPVDYVPTVPDIPLSGDLGFDLPALAGGSDRQWVTSDAVSAIWRGIRTNGLDVQFTYQGSTYIIALEVPQVTRLSPPAP